MGRQVFLTLKTASGFSCRLRDSSMNEDLGFKQVTYLRVSRSNFGPEEFCGGCCVSAGIAVFAGCQLGNRR